MDISTNQMISSIVRDAMQPAQTQAMVGVAMQRKALDMQQQMMTNLFAGLNSPQPNNTQPGVGMKIDFYA